MLERLNFLVAAIVFLPLIACVTNPSDTAALRAFHSQIIDTGNRLSNWRGDDPCGSDNRTQTNWEGVFCIQYPDNVFRVTELRLLNHELSGTLSPEIGNLDKLRILDVMWNKISGSIPPSFGRLESLELLLLNGNNLTGVLPWELGNLTKLDRIQIDQNHISGPVPPTFGNLTLVKHFHMNNNSLNGSIPPDVGRLPNIVHILLDNNQLTGRLPVTIANLSTLRILQLDNNRLEGEIPSEYEQIRTLYKLSLRNCSLTGFVPDLGDIDQLGYVDLSNNRLNGTIPTSALSSNITSIDLSNNLLTGGIPATFNSLSNLQALMLRGNNLSGSLNGSFVSSRNASHKLLLDFQNNSFSSADDAFLATSGAVNTTIWLAGNPLCGAGDARFTRICQSGDPMGAVQSDQTSPGLNTSQCQGDTCNPGVDELIPALARVGRCLCASPVVIGYRLKSPGFTFFERYRDRFDRYITSGLGLQLQQVYVRNVTWEPGPRLRMSYALYPAAANATDRNFTLPELRRLYATFAGWNIPDDDVFGPYEFISFQPPFGVDLYDITGAPSSKRLSGGALAGIIIGSIAGTALICLAACCLVHRKIKYRSKEEKRLIAERRRLHESIKVTGIRFFTLAEMKAATDSFSPARLAGQGGYGKVYRGIIDGDQVVAVKRAEEGSLQGSREFYTEIELLSRVHHRNLVSLIGVCDDEGEQMLIYEFMEGGTLRDRLSPTMRLPLDFSMRLRSALGSARGILYLHTEANPPIFHRDIKASNILLDSRNTAKVADFGLSRLAPSPDLDGSAPGHVSTVVKGTPGYLDPEYFLTRQLTDKSDVYSFGVVLMELVTGMHPISQGKNLVREVTMAYQTGSVLSLVDKRMGTYPSEGIEPLVRLAVRCCKERTDERPSMAEVVRDLEDIWKSMPWADAFSTFEIDKGEQKDVVTPLIPSNETFNNELYISSNAMDRSGLYSGTILNVAPR